MCLITNQEEPFIAKEDIKCWKVLRTNRRAIYHDFIYPEGQMVVSKIRPAVKEYGRFYCADEQDERYLSSHYGVDQWTIGHPDLFYFDLGFHVALTLQRALHLGTGGEETVVFDAIIPKGAKYYVGFTDLAVTNKLIVK